VFFHFWKRVDWKLSELLKPSDDWSAYKAIYINEIQEPNAFKLLSLEVHSIFEIRHLLGCIRAQIVELHKLENLSMSKVSPFVACIRAHVCSSTLGWKNYQITKADSVSRAKAVKFLTASSFAR